MVNPRCIYQPWPGLRPGAWANVWLEACGVRDCSQTTIQVSAGFTCVHLVTAGQVCYRSGKQVEVVLGPGSVFGNWVGTSFLLSAYPPGTGDAVELPWVRLLGPAAGAFVDALGLTPNHPYRTTRSPEAVHRIIRELIELGARQPEGAAFRAAALLYELPLACGPPPREALPPASLAERARDAMERSVALGMNIEQVCRAFGVGRTTLFTAFKEAFGQSPMEVLNRIRIERAQELLRGTDLSIAEVAAASGYGELSYFGRRFRCQVGTTPSAYRRRQANAAPEAAARCLPGRS
jgi:AraC-like DNA-binding protein